MKLLVANRSEIACRIFQTCREMGIATVGLVVPGDEQARHVTYADEVHEIPSYLDIEAIIKVAQSSKSKLVHPGYGFLSERPAFADAIEKANLLFVGPRAETMRLMGDKLAAKELAKKENVPTLPWATVNKGEDIRAAAKKIGYPILLKAAAGGGGKGMRRVNQEKDLEAFAESARAEAEAAFGDGTLFLEKLIEKPRHIEVQVFGDGRGGGIHLHNRECSLQRRHQKIWEEATAPHLSEKTKQGIYEAAMKLVRAVRYRSAGTLEFLVDGSGDFYFLEMNTRLQVEHPVTELVTGVDLVWAQITQAQTKNEILFDDVPSVRGHAIEVRLYAEDPSQGFIPTPGMIGKLKWPLGPGIRIDSGIEEGQTVGTLFDSMLGKLIVHGQNRDHALARLKFALEETVILGIGSNQNYLLSLATNPAVKEGRVSTHFLETEFQGFQPTLDDDLLEALSAGKAHGKLGNHLAPGPLNPPRSYPSPWGPHAYGGSRG